MCQASWAMRRIRIRRGSPSGCRAARPDRQLEHVSGIPWLLAAVEKGRDAPSGASDLPFPRSRWMFEEEGRLMAATLSRPRRRSHKLNAISGRTRRLARRADRPGCRRSTRFNREADRADELPIGGRRATAAREDGDPGTVEIGQDILDVADLLRHLGGELGRTISPMILGEPRCGPCSIKTLIAGPG